MMNPVPAPRRGTSRSGAGGRRSYSGAPGRDESERRREDAAPVMVASMLTTAGFKRSAMSANDVITAPAAGVLAARALASRGSGADVAGAGVIVPATIRPTRNETVAARPIVTAMNRRVMS